ESTARAALAGPQGVADPPTTTTIRSMLASALARQGRFEEATPLYRQAIFEAENRGDLDSASSIWCTWGFDALESDRVPLADTAFTEAFHLIRLHKLPRNQSRVLRGLARARSGMGDYSSAKLLFDAAITAPTGTEVRWVNLTARG